MENQLKLEIDGFGPIDYGLIDLKKLNIIAGVNSSGKTTSSKLLYSFLTSISPEGKYLASKSITKRLTPLLFIFQSIFQENAEISLKLNKLQKSIVNLDYEAIYKVLFEISAKNDYENKEKLENDLNQIKKIIEINKTQSKYSYILSELLSSEFRINNYPQDFKVTFCGNFYGNEFEYCLNSKNNKLQGKTTLGNLDALIFDEIIYIDSFSILDSFNDFSSKGIFEPTINTPFHIQDLSKKLRRKEEIDVYGKEFSKETEEIKSKIEKIIEGKIVFDYKKDEFIYKSVNKKFPMNNTASGIKQIGIIHLLLDKSIINKKSFVFIDEPELNLHPEWQLELAEIIVLISKISDITFYINSHSPLFIEALEVLSAKYDLREDTRFYLTVKDSCGKSKIERVCRKDLNLLYDNLGNPYDIIDKIRGENIKNHIYDDVG